MLKLKFSTDVTKLKEYWTSKYRIDEIPSNVIIETKKFCALVEKKWTDQELIACPLFEEITGMQLDGEISVFIVHPDLATAQYTDARTIEWGYRELYPQYIAVGLSHEILHCLTHDFYVALSDDQKWVFHACIYLAIDEELRMRLTKNDAYFSSPILDTYHPRLIHIAKDLLPKWKAHILAKERGTIIDFYKNLK